MSFLQAKNTIVKLFSAFQFLSSGRKKIEDDLMDIAGQGSLYIILCEVNGPVWGATMNVMWSCWLARSRSSSQYYDADL